MQRIHVTEHQFFLVVKFWDLDNHSFLPFPGTDEPGVSLSVSHRWSQLHGHGIHVFGFLCSFIIVVMVNSYVDLSELVAKRKRPAVTRESLSSTLLIISLRLQFALLFEQICWEWFELCLNLEGIT
jgi:hypothetical protein